MIMCARIRAPKRISKGRIGRRTPFLLFTANPIDIHNRCSRDRLYVNFPNDFGKKSEARNIVGGVGSGNWYRFDKKTTTDECQSMDVRYLHRNGLLKPGGWFSLRWSRAGRQTGSIGGVAYRDQVTLLYRHRRGMGGESEDVKETVPLDWTAFNFGGERP